MNSSSNIQISQSSLLSLKAEVLRKQQEVFKAKILQQQQQQTEQTQTPLREKSKQNANTNNSEPQNKGIEERRAQDEVEDEDLLQKSRRMLESKARLYNRLTKGPSDLTEEEIERNKHYLVQFDRKEKDVAEESSEEEHFSDEYEPAANPDEEWVEYTDCLGRTRKCLRKDIDYIKEKDFELSKTLDPERKKNITEGPKWVIDTSGSKSTDTHTENMKSVPEAVTENSELLSSDMRRELLREEWERQENELLNKKDIHYQDVLFNEARSHGVGYYAFSKDIEERAKQQEELNKLREETKEKQNNTLEQKTLRQQQMAARLKAARNRKRARMGLPPEEDEPEQSPPVEQTTESEEQKSKDATKQAEEKAKEKARQRHIRPWDIGKEGVSSKKHYEYSQEEWVDKKRKERQNEFAPPSFYKENKKKIQNDEESFVESDKSLYFTTKKSRGKREIPKYVEEDISDTSIPSPKFKSTSSINPYRDGLEDYKKQKAFEPTPIIDELEILDQEPPKINDERKKSKRTGAEIAPPPTFDYYGPSSTKSTKKSDPSLDLEDSIAAGLRFLREQSEKKEKNAERRNINSDL